jgi:UDP-N-acetylglucosamine--N-acetylmuramyl-(pentapeptide) pyrophosphoryl-undecaprenol N-acetylglucosamine transferase
MELAYAAADLVVCRAGAVTAAEVATAGVPAIFMPYPFHRDQHQRANAQVLADAGGALLVDDDGQAREDTVKALSRAVRTSLDDRYRLVQMSQNLQRLARVNADQEIAQWLMSD